MTLPRYNPQEAKASPNGWTERTAKVRKEECRIVLTHDELKSATEGSVLGLVTAFYGFKHPAEKPLDAIASAVGKDPATITHCISGHSHLGVSGWLTLEKLGMDGGLFSAWLAAQKEAT